VRYYLDRRRILAALRQMGVVLAIDSKNDPGTCTSTAATASIVRASRLWQME
jgi:hypothetical protein